MREPAQVDRVLLRERPVEAERLSDRRDLVRPRVLAGDQLGRVGRDEVREDKEEEAHAQEERGEQGWDVLILDPEGAPVWKRPCRSESEARTFGSTVMA